MVSFTLPLLQLPPRVIKMSLVISCRVALLMFDIAVQTQTHVSVCDRKTKSMFQEMMMQIMDKYVQAGEALAEKENDVRQLTKQVCW